MITKLKLKNWKSHLETELEFSKGVNALIGIMGSGKSSAVQAITFTLFGNFPALNKIRMDDIIMRKPQRKSFAEAELEFLANGKKYSVKRVIELGKGTTEAEIREDGKLIAVDSRHVTETVERVLQMDYDLFCRAVYSEQNALDYFLNLPKGKRTEHIDEMLQLDRFEAVRQAATALKNRLIAGIEERAKLLGELEKENIEEKMLNIKAELQEIRKNIVSLNRELQEVLTEKGDVEKAISEYEEKELSFRRAKENFEALRAGINELAKTIEKRRKETMGYDAKSLDETIKKNGYAISGLKKETEKMCREVSDARNRLSGLAANKALIEEKEMPRIEKIVSEVETHEKRTETITETIGGEPENILEKEKAVLEGLKEEHSRIKSEIEIISKGIEDLESAGAKCPVCESRIEEGKKEKLLRERREKNRALEEKHSKLMGEINRNAKQLKEIESMAGEYLLLKQKIIEGQNAKAEMEEVRKQLKQLEEEIKRNEPMAGELEKNCREKEEEIRRMEIENEKLCMILNQMEGIKELEGRKEEYELRAGPLEREITRLEAEMEKMDIKKVRSRLQTLSVAEGEINARKRHFEERVKEKEIETDELGKRQTFIDAEKRGIESDKAAAEKLEKFCSALKLTQIQLRENFLKTVNNIMAVMWEKLYPYGDFSGVRLSISEQYGDYVLEMKGSDGWVSADGIVSGGERSIACLALRVAFSLAFMPNLRWLILDEPTHNLDANAIKQLADVLRERMGDIVEQAFLITHEEGLSDGITGKLYKLERDKETDGVTKIMLMG